MKKHLLYLDLVIQILIPILWLFQEQRTEWVIWGLMALLTYGGWNFFFNILHLSFYKVKEDKRAKRRMNYFYYSLVCLLVIGGSYLFGKALTLNIQVAIGMIFLLLYWRILYLDLKHSVSEPEPKPVKE